MGDIRFIKSKSFYVYVDSDQTGYGFPIYAKDIPACVQKSLDTELYYFKNTINSVDINLRKV